MKLKTEKSYRSHSKKKAVTYDFLISNGIIRKMFFSQNRRRKGTNTGTNNGLNTPCPPAKTVNITQLLPYHIKMFHPPFLAYFWPISPILGGKKCFPKKSGTYNLISSAMLKFRET